MVIAVCSSDFNLSEDSESRYYKLGTSSGGDMSLLKLSILGAIFFIGTIAAFAQQCTLNTNPACASAVNLGTIAGDSGTPILTKTGVGEAFFMVRLREDSTSISLHDLSAKITLQSPSGANYDLRVRCTSCASSLQRISALGEGVPEDIRILQKDNFSDNSINLVIEVIYFSGSSCAAWTLTVNGNVAAGTNPLTCS